MQKLVYLGHGIVHPAWPFYLLNPKPVFWEEVLSSEIEEPSEKKVVLPLSS